MKVSFHHYTLTFRKSKIGCSSQTKREGALLKFEFEEGITGFSDCHPWHELGDLPLENQIRGLSEGRLTPLTRSSLALARIDGEARAKKMCLLETSRLPVSHYLVPDLHEITKLDLQELSDHGYTHLKIKVGQQPNEEARQLLALFEDSPFMLRLDFNERLTHSTFQVFCNEIIPLFEHIDFIEDPFPFDPKKWAAIQTQGWRLAADRQAGLAGGCVEAAAVISIKPALKLQTDWEKWPDQEKIFTGYLGHPLDQLAAAYMAMTNDPFGCSVHGLLAHTVYLPSDFSRQLPWNTPFFKPVKGTGFGFDQELTDLNWIPLKHESHLG